MNSDGASHLLLFSAEALIIALLLLGLFRMRSRLGLSLLYVTLGVFQPIQVLLASSIYAEIMPGLLVSPGSVVMFTASLFVILLVYIREDAIEARKIIYGIMTANLAMTVLMLLFGTQLDFPGTRNFLGLPGEIFNQGARVMISGTLALFVDVLLIIFVFEAAGRYITRVPFLRIYLTMAVILAIDTLIFAFGAFYGQPHYAAIVISGLVGKIGIAALYAAVLTLYLRFVDPAESLISSVERPLQDIFYVLTYREKYEIEKNHVQKVLQESEDRFRSAFELAAVGIAHVAPDGKWLWVNQKLCDIVGYSKDELMDLTFQDITHPDDLDADLAYVKQVINNEIKTYSMEKRHLRKDQSIVWINLTVSLVRWPSGEPKYFISVIEDIAERKKAEEEIFSLSKFPTENPYPILRIDSDGIIRYANAAGAPLLAMWDRQVGQTVPDDWQEKIYMALSNRANQEIEIDLGDRFFLYIVAPIVEQGYVNIYGQDITKNKKTAQELEQHREHLEELVSERTTDLKNSQAALINLLEDMNEAKKELQEANKKLKELDRLKSMFIASMSHELRTPLNSIIGFTGIMLQGMTGEINEEQRDHVQRVFRAGKHLLSLITDVIDIAKIESGKITPHAEEFLLKYVVIEACAGLEVQLADKSLELIKIIPETPITMHTDRRRLLQCLLNYLSNAVKFSEKGVVCVEVTEGQVSELARLRRGRGAEGQGEVAKGQRGKGAKGIAAQKERMALPKGWVEISVTDTGIGIREKDMKLLFGSFVRLETPLKTITPGTGLGLYLTRKLATEVLGGEVGAESEEGKGSRFWIRVPVCLSNKVAK